MSCTGTLRPAPTGPGEHFVGTATYSLSASNAMRSRAEPPRPGPDSRIRRHRTRTEHRNGAAHLIFAIPWSKLYQAGNRGKTTAIGSSLMIADGNAARTITVSQFDGKIHPRTRDSWCHRCRKIHSFASDIAPGGKILCYLDDGSFLVEADTEEHVINALQAWFSSGVTQRLRKYPQHTNNPLVLLGSEGNTDGTTASPVRHGETTALTHPPHVRRT